MKRFRVNPTHVLLYLFFSLFLSQSLLLNPSAHAASYVAAIGTSPPTLKIARINDLGGTPTTEQIEIDLSADFYKVDDVTFLASPDCCGPRVAVLGNTFNFVPYEFDIVSLRGWGDSHRLDGKIAIYSITPSGPLAVSLVRWDSYSQWFDTAWSARCTDPNDTYCYHGPISPVESYHIAGLSSGGVAVEAHGIRMSTTGFDGDRTYNKFILYDKDLRFRFMSDGPLSYWLSYGPSDSLFYIGRDLAGMSNSIEDKFVWTAKNSGITNRYRVDWEANDLIQESQLVNRWCANPGQISPLADIPDYIIGGGFALNCYGRVANVIPEFNDDQIFLFDWGSHFLQWGGTPPQADEVLGLSSIDGILYTMVRHYQDKADPTLPAYHLYQISKSVGNIDNYIDKNFSFEWNNNTFYRSDGDAILTNSIQEDAFTTVYLTGSTSAETSVEETLSSSNWSLQNGAVNGKLSGTFNFTKLEMIEIQTGSFTGKGITKGKWEATLEGAPYRGDWNGMFFRRTSEGKIYLKGIISGELSGTVEGELTETTPGSGVYDQYKAAWKLLEHNNKPLSGSIALEGTLTASGSPTPYPSAPISVLQASLSGTAAGHLPGPLSINITRLQINSQSNPYNGEGFSIISYIAANGSGSGWAYNRKFSDGQVDLKGVFSSPVPGFFCGSINELSSPKSMLLTVNRPDFGSPPQADLRLKVCGPSRVTSGEKFNYIIEYRNEGLLPAEDKTVVFTPSYFTDILSGSFGFIYDSIIHMGRFDLPNIAPKQGGYFSVQANAIWALPLETHLGVEVSVLPRIIANGVLLHHSPELSKEKRDLADAIWNGLNCANLESEAGGIKNIPYDVLVSLISRVNEKAKETFNGSVTPEVCYWRKLQNYFQEIGVYNEPSGVSFSLGNVTVSGSSPFSDLNSAAQDYLYGGLPIPSSDSSWSTYSEDIPGLKMEFNLCVRREIPVEYCPEWALPCVDLSGNELEVCWNENMPKADDEVSVDFKIENYDETTGYFDITISMTVLKDGQPVGITSVTTVHTKSGMGNVCDQLRTTLKDLLDDNFTEKNWLEDNGKTIKDLIREAQDSCNYNPCPPSDSKNCPVCLPDWDTEIILAHDPNIKYGPDGFISAGQELDYKVEFENIGEGSAYGVYFTDTLDEDVDASTLVIGPVYDKSNAQISGPGTYNPANRTITWFAGEVGPSEGGYAEFSVNVRSNAPLGTEVINYGTVYFPSVPEETRTNGIVSYIPYTISASAGPGGVISPSGNVPVAPNGEQKFTITPNIGYRIAEVRIDNVPISRVVFYTFRGVRANHSISVTFETADKDDDGMPDDWESANGLNPYDPNDAALDSDGDGLTSYQEYLNNTKPNNPDTDGDGMPDGWEVAHGLNPLVDDASGDLDSDGYTNLQEFDGQSDPRDPNSKPNRPPVANAGPDQNVPVSRSVTLDGTGSFDPESKTITYLWEFTSVPSESVVALSDETVAQPTFTPDVIGEYSLELVVNDGSLDSLSDEVVITAYKENVAPNANAGKDQNVTTGTTVVLDGSGSSDPDNDPLTHAWSFISVPSESTLSAITDSNRQMASFVPDVDGDYVIKLTVSDGDLASDDDTLVVSTTLNVRPNARAGDDLTIALGEVAALDGSASHDPDDWPWAELSFSWSFVSVPLGSKLAKEDIQDADTASPHFTPDVAGTFVLQLTVSDGAETNTDNVAVIAVPRGKTLYSELGDDPKPSILDQDVYKFSGSKGEKVTVRLAADPQEAGLGKRASLILVDWIKGKWLLKIDSGELPNEVSATLPGTGYYYITVSEQARLRKLEPFRGPYCLTLEASPPTQLTFQPAAWVE